MSFKSEIFDVEYRHLNNSNYLHFISIREINTTLKNFIDISISRICYGPDDTDISTIKQELLNFFETKKKDENKRIIKGAIAEFFVSLYLLEIGFKQEYLFLNLEENSIKKGFDGYFSFLKEEWILESKSGSIKTENTNHKNKITEAYVDLQKKIETPIKNNPWKNAFNHAKLVGSNPDIIKNLKKLSNNFINKKYPKIKDFNVIPSSTIFFDEEWIDFDINDLEIKIKEFLSNKDYKGINVICVNNKSIELFLNYLNS